jgi:hypothetical protein
VEKVTEMEEERRQLRELNQRIIDGDILTPPQEAVRQDLMRLLAPGIFLRPYL